MPGAISAAAGTLLLVRVVDVAMTRDIGCGFGCSWWRSRRENAPSTAFGGRM